IQGKSFEELYDIYAVRIIVDTVIDCYNILGLMHDMFTPIPNRFKDYISTPKANMYQSLHTTVIDKEGVPFEIQIRTWEMHHTAEYGIAAHWKYKAGLQGKDKLEDRLAWIRKLLESQSDDVEEIVRTIKTDLSPEDVFVFTPKGDVKSLPVGSTVIDFAYAIHSEVGSRMIGAKIDGRMVSIDSEVKTGQIVDIITSNSPGRGPSRDWLKIVKTSEAKSKIRTWFKRERREENISEGRDEIEREFRRNGIHVPEEDAAGFIEELARRQHCAGVDELYAAIGYGGISLSKIMPRIKDDYLKTYKPVEASVQGMLKKRTKTVSGGVVVEDIDGCLVKFAQCCNPLPGDDIIGFVTRGYGVSVHKRDCVNVLASMEKGDQLERWVTVQWSDEVKETFKSTIEILAHDRAGMIADVTVALSNMHLQIKELNARELKDGYVGIHVTIGISGREQLQNVMANLGRIDNVSSVIRTGK
ncbi:MAG: bifunctional (p)ppGpp synthetase/guanosine-3',5'-bis(diphosphate) 3'-pyrophosphohydrolase, partial [Acetanaerobacterium sp.]